MIKRITAAVLALLLGVCAAGCGEKTDGDSGKKADLTSFYDQLANKFGWADTYMIDLNDEMLDSSYPGLRQIASGQLVAKMPQMSSVVNEIVLVECASEEDAQRAAELFRSRIDDQANGGAWYPDSMEAWSNAQVYTEGNYAAMIASAEHQDEIGSEFTALFA
ncbi:MAG: DUF4358 domain-containing protein [Oscillibacter sp.]|jgi:rhodanese-related sulfurtransferase|nr:DUF4358 domain-containing protein [Oscillibacter sp.]